MSKTPTSVRHPRRGKAHRRTIDSYTSTLYPGSTVCGRWARDLTEENPIGFIDAYDRCIRCWAGTEWEASR